MSVPKTENIAALLQVKRHKQLMAQEAADLRGRAIQSYIFRAFSEEGAPGPAPEGSANANPLGRAHRLRGTNPLIDD